MFERRSSKAALLQPEPVTARPAVAGRHAGTPHQLLQRQRITQCFGEAAAPAATSTIGRRDRLPATLRAGVESLSGLDLSSVRVHRNSSAPAQLNALAYARGADIHLGPGQEKHLPHEAWHVVQQMQGRVRPTLQAAGAPINDDPALEREADHMGAKVLQRQLAEGSTSIFGGMRFQGYAPKGSEWLGYSIAGQHWGNGVSDKRIDAVIEKVKGEGSKISGEKLDQIIKENFGEDSWGGKNARDKVVDKLLGHESVEFVELDEDRYDLQDDDCPTVFHENIGLGGNEEIEENDPRYAELLGGSKRPVIQGKRAGGKTSDAKTFDMASQKFKYKEVAYTTEPDGNINFGSTPSNKNWKNPVHDTHKSVDLNAGVRSPGYGMMRSGNIVKIKGASRAQHFSIANRITGVSAGSGSPTNWTWHHLSAFPKMALVDRAVHARYGHNGGVYLW